MSRGGWTIQIKSSGSWIADGTIYPMNDNLSQVTRSTQVTAQLADGSQAFISPSTKYIEEPLRLIWYNDDGTTKTKLEGYVTSQNDVKIIDHDSNEYVGRFTQVDALQMVGVSPDQYDIQAIFIRMPGLA